MSNTHRNSCCCCCVDIVFSKDENFTVALLYFDDNNNVEHKAWRILGKSRFHTKSICDVLYISQPAATHASSQQHHKVVPRLISLAQDRVRFFFHFSFNRFRFALTKRWKSSEIRSLCAFFLSLFFDLTANRGV